MLSDEQAKAIGKLIKSYRSGLNLTQKQFAPIAGISPTLLNRIEQGITHSTQQRTLTRIVERLELTEAQSAHLMSLAGYVLKPVNLEPVTDQELKLLQYSRALGLDFSESLFKMVEGAHKNNI